MIAQLLFLFALQGFGILFGLAFKKRIPLPFVCLSGLLWGGLFWVLAVMALLVLGLPFTPASSGLLIGLLALGLVVWNALRGNFRLSAAELKWMVAFMALSALLFALAARFNFTFITPDSLAMILNGRAFSFSWSSPTIQQELALRGVFVPALQSASVFLRVDYLSAFQPSCSVLFGGLFIYLSRAMLASLKPAKAAPFWLPILALAALLSLYVILLQLFYIHTNLLSGIFLMVSLACFWLGLKEDNPAWLVFASLSLLAFGLLRTEAPAFILIVLLVLFSYPRLRYVTRLAVCLPLALFFSGWYLYLMTAMGAGTYILNPTNTLLVVVGMLAAAVLALVSGLGWVERIILPRLKWILWIGLAVGLAALALFDGGRASSRLETFVLNLFATGLWGWGWVALAAAAALALAQPAMPYEGLFAASLPAVLLFIYMVYTQAADYKFEWSDSANRMLTHVVPALFLYLTVKFGQALPAPAAGRRPISNRQVLLIGTGVGIIVFTLAVVLGG